TERDGRMRLLLLLLVFSSLGLPAKRARSKYYETHQLPKMKWDVKTSGGDNDEATPISYKHELVISGGKTMAVKPGWNYSVHPTGNCHDQRIIFVVQLEHKRKDWKSSELRQEAACTVVITIDDGHVEAWYGLCRGPKPATERKFDFPLSQMNSLYFTFEGFTMRMYKRVGDDGQDYEMGKIEHVVKTSGKDEKSSNDQTKEDYDFIKNYTAFKQFVAFLHIDSCDTVTMKTVYHIDDWRHTNKTVKGARSTETALLIRMFAIFSFFLSIGCLILSTMYVWSTGMPFFSNRIYDTVFARFSKDSTVVLQEEEEEANSCKTAEDQSVDGGDKGEKENIFGDKGRPMRLPSGIPIPDWDAPLEEEDDDGLKTAVDKEEEAAAPLIPETPPAATPPVQPDQAPAPDAKRAAGIVV
ncbi:hypothetical protein PENTCL1PPCAC_21836, partial [Pristionchus entomophagus]